MTTKEVTTFVIGGVVVGAIVVAFFLLLGDKPPPPFYWHKDCTEEKDCTSEKNECAVCWHCQKALKRCYYSMDPSENCQCVEKETMACTQPDGNPGVKVCERIGSLHTTWSADCKKPEK